MDTYHAGNASLDSGLAFSVCMPSSAPLSGYFFQAPLPFIEQDHSAVREHGGYEPFIEQHGAIPTRLANWHDYYNAMSWHCFPTSKLALHRSQIAHSALNGNSGNKRSPQQNAATLFDENGVIVYSSEPWVFAALEAHDWETLFIRRRDELQLCAGLLLLGHAMLEKMRAPYIGMTAKWVGISVTTDFHHKDIDDKFRLVDQAFAQLLPLINTDLHALPILGWPQWWPGNNDPHFYANTDYFRAAKPSAPKKR